MIRQKSTSILAPGYSAVSSTALRYFKAFSFIKGACLCFRCSISHWVFAFISLLYNYKQEYFWVPPPDNFSNVLTPVLRTMTMSRWLKYFSNQLCQSLSLAGNDCNSGVINGRMNRLGKVPKLHPTFLVFISKQNSKRNWISVTISSGTITGVQSILPKSHVACICLEYSLEKRHGLTCTQCWK
jgi:hypothetical protein